MKRKLDEGEDNNDINTEEVSVIRRINFDEETSEDSDNEIFFNKQAHKKRKMSQEISDLKIWLDSRLELVATRAQTQSILDNVAANKERGIRNENEIIEIKGCLLYTSPSPRDLSTSRMPSSA